MEDLFERTILIVDDEAINREILGNIVQSEYKVIYAENGKEALEKIHSMGTAISLVLLDLLMPVMDGNEVLKTMNEEGLIIDIPVIVLTSEKSSEIESLKAGAADFLTKPYDSPEVILARVRHSIQLFENSRIIHATEFDKLTLLYTPEFFFEYASQFDQRFPDKVMDAIAVNFTRFHLLNQLKGRNFGNTILNAMADGIRKALLKTGGIAGRNEADSFYLYIPHLDDYKIILEKITQALSEFLKPSEIRLRLGVYTDTNRSFAMIQRFDHAVQACNSLRNKTSGSSDICSYDDKMAEKEVFDAHLLQDLKPRLNKSSSR